MCEASEAVQSAERTEFTLAGGQCCYFTAVLKLSVLKNGVHAVCSGDKSCRRAHAHVRRGSQWRKCGILCRSFANFSLYFQHLSQSGPVC